MAKQRRLKRRRGRPCDRWLPRLEALEDRQLPSLVPYLVANVGTFPDLANVNGTLFFSGSDGVDQGLWRSNGTAASTMLVKEIDAGSGSYGDLLTNVNGTLFFQATDPASNGPALWRSNGTAAGTVVVADVNVDDARGFGYPAAANVSGTFFFSADDGVHGQQLWRSDGTSCRHQHDHGRDRVDAWLFGERQRYLVFQRN